MTNKLGRALKQARDRQQKAIRLGLGMRRAVRLSSDLGEGRWITIGSDKGADGKRTGGSAVFIDKDGTMKTGKFAGSTLEEAFKKGGKADEEQKPFASVERLRDGKMQPIDFDKGESVDIASQGPGSKPYRGKLVGVSKDGKTVTIESPMGSKLKYPIGAIYKAGELLPKPAAAAPKQPAREDTVSGAVDRVNNRFGEGLTEADRVPDSAQPPQKRIGPDGKTYTGPERQDKDYFDLGRDKFFKETKAVKGTGGFYAVMDRSNGQVVRSKLAQSAAEAKARAWQALQVTHGGAQPDNRAPSAQDEQPKPTPTLADGISKVAKQRVRSIARKLAPDNPAKAQEVERAIMATWKVQKQAVDEHNDALRQVIGHFSRQHGAIASQLVRGADVTKIPKFDQMVEHAERYYPQLVAKVRTESGSGSAEEGLAAALREGIKPVPQPWHDSVIEATRDMLGRDYLRTDDDDVEEALESEEWTDPIPFGLRMSLARGLRRAMRMSSELPRAPVGGMVSTVNGQFYDGGKFMPDTGVFSNVKKKAKRHSKINGANWSELNVTPARKGYWVEVRRVGDSKSTALEKKPFDSREEAIAFATEVLEQREKSYKAEGLAPHPTALLVDGKKQKRAS